MASQSSRPVSRSARGLPQHGQGCIQRHAGYNRPSLLLGRKLKRFFFFNYLFGDFYIGSHTMP